MGEVKTRPITPNQFDEFVEENDLVKTPEDMVAIEVSDIALKVEREMKQEVREYNKDYVLEPWKTQSVPEVPLMVLRPALQE